MPPERPSTLERPDTHLLTHETGSAQEGSHEHAPGRLGFGRWVRPGLESLIATLKVLPDFAKVLLADAERHLARCPPAR